MNKKESSKIASKKYYETHKEKILLKKRQKYKSIVKKEKIFDNDKLIQEAVYFDTFEGRYKRIDNVPKNPIKSSKRYEFLWVLETLTKTKFDASEWENSEQSFDYGNDTNGTMCICTKAITNDYTIIHKPTQMCFEVGCDCVRKIDDDLYLKLTKTECLYCDNPVLDRRTKKGKLGLCNNCVPIAVFRFGKYKGTPVTEVPKSYCVWAYHSEYNFSDELKNSIEQHVF